MKKLLPLYLLIINFTIINAQQWVDVGGGTNGPIKALAVYNGELYAGGSFTQVGGITPSGIAKWDGTAWSQTGIDANYVNSLYVFNGELFSTGSFQGLGSSSCHIVKYDGNTWQCIAGILNSASFKAINDFNGELYFGGSTSTILIGNTYVNFGGIARWDGLNWSLVDTGFTYTINPSIHSLGNYNGELYSAGSFSGASGIPVNNVARWNGTNWSAVSTGLNGPVLALRSFNGDLYAGGLVTIPGSWEGFGIVKWNGTIWSHVITGIDQGFSPILTSVNALTTFNNELILAGHFSMAGTTLVNNIATWNGQSFNPLGSGIKRSIHALAVYNGELYAAGDFDSAGVNPMNYITKWSTGVSINENESFSALEIYPNPISGNCHIRFTLPIEENISVSVVDLTGRKIITITENLEFAAGNHYFTWNASGIGCGLYFLKMETETSSETRKIIINNN